MKREGPLDFVEVYTAAVHDVVLFNPIAGRGKAAQAAAAIEAALRDRGRRAVLFSTRLAADYPELDEALEQASSLIVAGGDGTIRQAAPFAVRHGAPLYQVPFGTENLFAREFGMDRRMATLLRALGNEPRTVDVGLVNGQMFLMMVSVGLDAEVIHDLMAKRQGAISHWHYLRPIFRQWLGWRPVDMRIEVDAETLEPRGPGMVVVANARQYAFRFDPAPHASMSDGLLDVVHIEARSRISFAITAIRTRLRRHLRSPCVLHRTGRSVHIECAAPQRYQIDGDAALEEVCGDGGLPRSACYTPLDITIRPGSLRVLAP
jgi:diacylglycerol kinase (ATP)